MEGLIAKTPEEYEQFAIELARDKSALKVIKERLAKNRLVKPLFDTPRFTKNLEALYKKMYERHEAGLPPDHISGP